MIEEFDSPSLNNLKDSIEDALTSESPQDILDCIMLTLKRNSQYHRICAEINAGALDDDYLTDPKKWTEIVAENTVSLDEEEMIANGYQLTDTGWVKA